MIQRKKAPAELPPAGLSGMCPSWSRLVSAEDSEGKTRTWHLLDSWSGLSSDDAASAANTPSLTLLCVHGNPSWSYLWRHLLTRAPTSIRVIAVDQLDMGFSERTGVKRTLAMRIDDLCHLTTTLQLEGAVITVAHDWGGPISLGWALKHLNQNAQAENNAYLAGVVLTNTAVHQPQAASVPSLIRLIRSAGFLKLLTVSTRAFISGALKMSRPALSDPISAGFHAPYLHASRRLAIRDFVADIPLEQDHESAAALDSIATRLAEFTHTPVLMMWGARDRVFNDNYLDDLHNRLPHADVHRYPKAAHFVTEDVDAAGALFAWLSMRWPSTDADSPRLPVNASSDMRAGDTKRTVLDTRRALADFSIAEHSTLAVAEPPPSRRSINFGELASKVDTLAAGMAAYGIAPGMRVAVMIMPGVDLCVVVYACWRLGAALVLVDSGLGRNGMQSALLGARPDYLIGIDKALLASRILGWPGKKIALGHCSSLKRRALDIVTDVESLSERGRAENLPPWPASDSVAAVAFTSGSTGPSKGVVYLHSQIEAQRDALMRLYGITASDKLVAAFAPFALYAPTMGITSMVPDMDVTKPATLTASSLVDAVQKIKATLVFASPAALVNVVATRQQLSNDTLTDRNAVRLALSAGAPVRASLLQAATNVFPNASMHTPYGMTEVLPVADISLEALKTLNTFAGVEDGEGGSNNAGHRTAGVCVGAVLDSVQIAIDPLDQQGVPTGSLTSQAGVLGEIIVRADHIRHSYDRLWHTQHLASQPAGCHRTGDIGQLDSAGRLWVGGRLGHVIASPAGPLAPVACEQIIESIDGVDMAAVVGVGPIGRQAVVAIIQSQAERYATGSAPLELVDRIRLSVQSIADIAAVLIVKHLPVDRRHNSKVDRTAVSQWAATVLAGDKVPSL